MGKLVPLLFVLALGLPLTHPLAEAAFRAIEARGVVAPDGPAVDPEPVLGVSSAASDQGAFPVSPVSFKPERMACRNYGSRRFCDGPRKVPVASGPSADQAHALGLGSKGAVRLLRRERPRPEWVDAVPGETDGSLLWPVRGGRYVRGFGYVRRAELRHRRHDGVDISAPVGTPVRAVADGLVAYADNGVRGFGNMVVLIHKDGSTSSYAHLETALVFPGQDAPRGAVIGTVGNTGISRGPHLHFEWRQGGRVRDPLPRFVEGPASVMGRRTRSRH